MAGTVTQEFLTVPVDRLVPHPKNPRRGDVGAITASVGANGFYGALVVQRGTNYILAGNHRWKAAKASGLKEVPALILDVDDDRALRILLADNKTSDDASYNDKDLLGVLQELEAGAGLSGTGYERDDLDEVLHRVTQLSQNAAAHAKRGGGGGGGGGAPSGGGAHPGPGERGSESGGVTGPTAESGPAARASEIRQGDCRTMIADVPEKSVDAVICDPPYELGLGGVAWDSTGAAFSAELWRGCLRALKPGGHLIAFGGTRTYHRLVTAVEAAGFEVRDCLQWLYATGMPKSWDVAKQDGVDAERWEGWGTCLKPAVELVLLARRPMDGTIGENISRWGVGGLNIGACGVGVEGTWPTNVLMDEGAAAMLDQQGAPRCFYVTRATREERDAGVSEPEEPREETTARDSPDGMHGAQTTVGVPLGKNRHPCLKPISLMRHLCRLVTPPGGMILDPFCGSGSTGCAAVLEGFRFLGFELSPEYARVAAERIRWWQFDGGKSLTDPPDL